MTDQNRECPKCKAVTEVGFLLDRGHMSAAFAGTWVDGPGLPPPSLKKLFSDPLQGKRQRPITGNRCTVCGYLELYANDA